MKMDFDKIDWKNIQFTDKAVLCYITTEHNILLIYKKTGLGAGKINAPGGRIEPGETEKQAAIRETEEETGLIPQNVIKKAELHFLFTSGYSLFGSVFVATGYEGMMRETKEAIPSWYAYDTIPYEKMWEDDTLWLPEVLAGTELKGYFLFSGDRMLNSKITKTTFRD
jgi:8-oxo-dGTP diphosphatase